MDKIGVREDALLVAVDNGHYGIKYYSGVQGVKGSIESRCRIGSSTTTELIKGSNVNPGQDKELVLTSEGQQYTTGSMQAMPTTFTEYPISPINRVLVHSALHQAGLAGRTVELVLGLPFSQYYDTNTESGRNESLIRGMEANIAKAVSVQNVEPITVVKASTVPEGMAAWFSYVMKETVTEKGRSKIVEVAYNEDLAAETVVLIDIGGQTTEVVTVANQAAMKNYSGTFTKGSHRIIEELKRYIYQESRVSNISDSKIRRALETGTITVSSKVIDCRLVIKNSTDQLLQEIKAEVDTLTNPIEGDIDRRLFLGGTSLLLADGIKGWKNAELLDDPVHANAIGAYLFMKYLN